MGSWRVPPGVYSVLGQHVPWPDPYVAAASLDIAAAEGLVPVGVGFRGGGGAGAPAEAAPVHAADDVADADDGTPAAAAAAAAGAGADEEEEDPLLELTRKSPLPDTPSDGEGEEVPPPLCAPPAAGSLSDSMLPDSGENWHQFYRRRCEELCLSVWTTKRSRFNHPARYGDTGSSSRQKCLGNVDWIAMLWSSKRLSDPERLAVAARVLCMLKRIVHHYVDPGVTQPHRLEVLNRELRDFDCAPAACGTARAPFSYDHVDPFFFPPDFIGWWCKQQADATTDLLCNQWGDQALRQRLSALLMALDPQRDAFPLGLLTHPCRKQPWVEPLSVLRWMGYLCRTRAVDAGAVLDHAERCIADLHARPAAAPLQRHQVHAALDCAVLSSAVFSQHCDDKMSSGLDELQRKAVEYAGDTPLLIEAGPGAGKTRTIGRRSLLLMRRFIGQAGLQTSCRLEDIVAVTFTKRAAGALREVLGDLGPLPSVATMDSFLVTLIYDLRRRSGIRERLSFAVALEKDIPAVTATVPVAHLGDAAVQTLQSKLAEIVHSACCQTTPFATVEAIASAVAATLLLAFIRESRPLRRMLRDPPTDEVVAAVGVALGKDVAAAEQAQKEKPLKAARAWFNLLFSDADGAASATLAFCLAALCTWARDTGVYSLDMDKELLLLAMLLPSPQEAGLACAPPPWTARCGAAGTSWRQEHSLAHFIIDEFQDTSPVQLAVFSSLAGRRLTVVGDCDQAIYGFRGARYPEVEAALRAQRPYRVLLKYNYRSTPHIVATSTAVVAPNYGPQGGYKRLEAACRLDEGASDLRVRLVVHTPQSLKKSISEHGTAVVAQVTALRAAGCEPHDMAILCYTNEAVDEFLELLRGAGMTDCRRLKGAVEDNDRDGTLKVGTVHDAKGLEWAVVFLYAFDMAQFFATKGGDEPELRRVLYVGCSRAARLLYIHVTSDAGSLVSSVAALGEQHVARLTLEEATALPVDAGALAV